MRTRQLMAITLFTMAPATNTERVSKNWLCTLLPIKAIHRGFIGDATAPGNLHLHRHAALRCAYSTSLIPIALSTIRAGHNRTPTERQPNANRTPARVEKVAMRVSAGKGRPFRDTNLLALM